MTRIALLIIMSKLIQRVWTLGRILPEEIPTEAVKIPISEWDKIYYFEKGYVKYLRSAVEPNKMKCEFGFPDFAVKNPMRIPGSEKLLSEGFSKVSLLDQEGTSLLVQFFDKEMVLTKISEDKVTVQKQVIDTKQSLSSGLNPYRFLEHIPEPELNGGKKLIEFVILNVGNTFRAISCDTEELKCTILSSKKLKLVGVVLLNGPLKQHFINLKNPEDNTQKLVKLNRDWSFDDSSVTYTFETGLYMVTFYEYSQKWYGIAGPDLWELKLEDNILKRSKKMMEKYHFYGIYSTNSYLCSMYLIKDKGLFTTCFYRDKLTNKHAFRISGLNLSETFLMEWHSFLMVYNRKYMLSLKPPPKVEADPKLSFTYFPLATFLNSSSVLSNGDLRGVIPTGKYVNSLKLLIYDSDLQEHIFRSLEVDAMIMDCRKIETQDLLDYTFPIKVYYENEEDVLKPIVYKFSFFDDRELFSFILIIILGVVGALLLCLVVFIIYKIRRVAISRRELEQIRMIYQMSSKSPKNTDVISEKFTVEDMMVRMPSRRHRLTSFDEDELFNSTAGDFSFLVEDMETGVVGRLSRHDVFNSTIDDKDGFMGGFRARKNGNEEIEVAGEMDNKYN